MAAIDNFIEECEQNNIIDSFITKQFIINTNANDPHIHALICMYTTGNFTEREKILFFTLFHIVLLKCLPRKI